MNNYSKWSLIRFSVIYVVVTLLLSWGLAKAGLGLVITDSMSDLKVNLLTGVAAVVYVAIYFGFISVLYLFLNYYMNIKVIDKAEFRNTLDTIYAWCFNLLASIIAFNVIMLEGLTKNLDFNLLLLIGVILVYISHTIYKQRLFGFIKEEGVVKYFLKYVRCLLTAISRNLKKYSTVVYSLLWFMLSWSIGIPLNHILSQGILMLLLLQYLRRNRI